jgi:predicted Zn-dependent protease
MRGPRLLAALALVASCAVSSETAEVITPTAAEQKTGDDAAKQVAEGMGFVADPELQAYAEEIGARLAQHASRQDVKYRIHVVDAPEPNAFALPGGYVYVTRGLLAITNSEDELACVIGHEIGHVAARHYAKGRVRSSVFLPVQIAAGLTAFATSIVSPRLGQAVGGIVALPGALTLAAYDRDQEREADALGQQYAADEGWDPAAMSNMMDTLGREQALQAGSDGATRLAWLSSHPSSPERSRDTAERAKQLERAEPHPIAGTRAAYFERLDGLVVGMSGAEGVFVETRFLHADLDFTLLFPEGWETHNARTMVAARSPDKQSHAAVNLVDAKDPSEAASRFSKESRAHFDRGPERIQIAGSEAVRAETRAGSWLERYRVHLTWIQHGEHVFQIAGVAPEQGYDRLRPTFDAIAASFHSLTPAERAQVTEKRLRIAAARGGETLAQLAEREKSAWSAEEAAVANALVSTEVLHSGLAVKLARSERYVP